MLSLFVLDLKNLLLKQTERNQLPPANEVWGKVYRRVSVHGGGEYLTRYTPPGPGTPPPPGSRYPPRSRHPPGTDTPPGADLPQEQTYPGSKPPLPQEQTPPRCRHTPWEQTPPQSRHPLEADTPHPHPPSRHPLEQTPPQEQTPPGTDTPRHRACWEIRSTRGRYASYWNAILLLTSVKKSRDFGGRGTVCKKTL